MSSLVEFLKNSKEPDEPKFDENGALIDDHKDEEYYEKLFELTDLEFPDCPFSISLGREDLLNLDEPFTEEPVIFIKDDRTNSYYYDNLTQSEKNEYINYTKVEQIDAKPITLRQVLNSMSEDPHYRIPAVIEDDHRFLEFFDKKTDIQYEMFFGS